jgi:hypothetical protein
MFFALSFTLPAKKSHSLPLTLPACPNGQHTLGTEQEYLVLNFILVLN